MKYALLLSCLAVIAGCGAEELPGRTRSLGRVDYEQAFGVAEGVMSRHFEIASADLESGVIQCRPTPVEAGGERLLGSSPARRVATLKLSRGEQVIARLTIAQQRLGRDITAVAPGPRDESYSGSPDRTPAHSPEQLDISKEDDWRLERYAHDQAVEILDEIQQALSGAPATMPATAPVE